MTFRFAPALIAGLFLSLGLASTADAQTPAIVPAQRVLVLYSDERLLPANVVGDAAIRAEFAVGADTPFEFHSEFLDPARFPGDEITARHRDFLRDKYRERPPELIIAGGSPAFKFLVQFRESLFSTVPIVYCSVGEKELPAVLPDAKIVGIPVLGSYADTLELALQVRPGTRQVAVVVGSSARDREFRESFENQMRPLPTGVTLTWLTDLSLDELRAALSRLPGRTLVLYLVMFEDAAGRTFTPRQALELFSSASRAPIFGPFDTYIGHGIVGGSMVTFDEIGRKAAQVGLRILAGEEPQTAARAESHAATPIFEGPELRRWKIDETLLPPGSVVQNREDTYWEKHHRVILGAAALCAIEALLIAALLLQLRRRRRAEESLRVSEVRVNLAADSAGSGLWSVDPECGTVWATDHTREMFGIAPGEPLGWERFRDAIHPEDRERTTRAALAAMNEGKLFVAEFRVGDGNGTTRWLISRGRVQRRTDGRPLLLMGASVDITERKRAEEEVQLRHQELIHLSRVSLAGELSGSLVHELGQPLGAILANAEAAELHLGRAVPDPAELAAMLADIRQDCLRAGGIIHSMRTFLRRHQPEFQPVDLDSVFAELEKVVGTAATLRHATLDFQTAPGLPAIHGSRVQLQQVLLNLIVNGLEAMEDCPVAERRMKVTTTVGADAVEIAVRDQGRGLSAEQLDQSSHPSSPARRPAWASD